MASANHTEVFNCSPAEFFKVIADYERYPEFLNEVKECRVIQTDGARKLVQYKIAVLKTFTYSLWMTENPLSSISWEFAGGDLFKSSTGSWKLVEEAGKTRATYAIDAQFSLFVPGPIAKSVLTVNLPTMMSSYHRRIKEIYGK